MVCSFPIVVCALRVQGGFVWKKVFVERCVKRVYFLNFVYSGNDLELTCLLRCKVCETWESTRIEFIADG